jgi:hypothetical protein
MKPKENFLEDYLMTKIEDNNKKKGNIFPLGYRDKRDSLKKHRRKSKKSSSSSKSGSSESIEEKNEDLEDDDLGKNNSDPGKNNDILIGDKNFNLFPNDDSDSEIVEEEIITEETIAKIYADKTDQFILEKNKIDINTDISPISETLIVKTNNTTENNNKSYSDDNIIVKEKTRRIFKYKDNILFKYFNHKSLIAKMRIITLIILLIYIFLVILSIFSYTFQKDKLNIFCFEFIENGDTQNPKYRHKLFLSDRNSFFSVQILCGIPFISVVVALIKNNYLQLKQFFKITSFYFPLTLVLNIPIFILGIIKDEYENSDGSIGIVLPIIFTFLTLIGFLCMTFILLSAKNHKYKSVPSLINISILCSFFSSFELYSFLYNVCLLIRAIYGKEMYIPEIIMGIIFFLFGMFIMISFKDIFYVLVVCTIELGLLYIKKNIAVTIVNLSTTFFSFGSIIIHNLLYKKKIFGLSHMD